MPPSGGNRTSLSATIQATFAPSWGQFSPGVPLSPSPPHPVRHFDFNVGANTTTNPRAYEPFGFPELRAFANVELVRMAIETRKDQVERLDWQIKPIDGRKARADALDRIRKVTKFWRKPDGVTHFATWLRSAMEDLLTLDAPAFEKRRNRLGDLVALDVIPGDTIKILVDETGRRPLPPAPAYQQIIKGLPWANLTTEDILYAPRNVRPHHLYGFGPVEQIIVTIHTAMRRQTAQLAYFTESNIPLGIINAPEGWTPDQIKDFQDWMDSRLTGNAAERSKLLWTPFGAKYQSFKDAPIKDEFDEWLARVVCYCFSLPPTPFIKQMNRSTADNDNERSLEEGLGPLKLWAKRHIDGIIHDDMGFADLEFSWNDAEEIEPSTQSEIDDRDLRNASTTINQIRDRRGEDPVEGGDVPMIYTATGAVPLPSVHATGAADIATANAIVKNGGMLPQPKTDDGDKPAKSGAGDKSKQAKDKSKE